MTESHRDQVVDGVRLAARAGAPAWWIPPGGGDQLRAACGVSALVRWAAAKERTMGWFDPWALPGGFDPTGLVKGWAAHRALRAMAHWGVRHALVNAGGDVAVRGDADGTGDGSGWAIGIQDPFVPSGLLTSVRGTDLPVATSGGYGPWPTPAPPVLASIFHGSW